MLGLLNWRLWAAAGFLCLLPILYMKGRADGRTMERAEVAAAIAQANVEARKMEQRRQARADQAAKLGAAREARIRADAASAARAADGLRDTLDAVERAAQASLAAANKSTAALRAVFESCVAEYRALAEAADGHASDALKFEQAWPK